MNVSDVSAESALSLLSEEERERAADFVFERDRVRYIFSHGFLRQVLGLYLGIDPQSIPFQFGSNGRPEISSK
ncbi:MAG TPA: 4'-phosphopantetheinyl transferase, partial [Spirochaetia bacterium]|nr:4'-phosphopantetheinyl transferase [Spirochaetia bacterium]